MDIERQKYSTFYLFLEVARNMAGSLKRRYLKSRQKCENIGFKKFCISFRFNQVPDIPTKGKKASEKSYFVKCVESIDLLIN